MRHFFFFLAVFVAIPSFGATSHSIHCSYRGGPMEGTGTDKYIALGEETQKLDFEYSFRWKVDLSKVPGWKWGPGTLRVDGDPTPKGHVSFDLEADLPKAELNIGWSSIPAIKGHEIILSRYYNDKHLGFEANCKIIQ